MLVPIMTIGHKGIKSKRRWPKSLVKICPLCGGPDIGPGGCVCPGSGMLAGENGTIDLGIERDPLIGVTNNFTVFHENFEAIIRGEDDVLR